MNVTMLRRASLIIFSLLVLTASVACAAVEFVYPAPSSWVKNSDHMIIKLNQIDLTAVRISVNGLASELIDVGSPEYLKLFRDYFIAQALWDSGKNSIQIDLFKGG